MRTRKVAYDYVDVAVVPFLTPLSQELTQSGQTEAYAYVNAVRWQDGEDIYVVDRFSGALTVEPGKRLYQCEKVGGRKF